MTYSLKDWIRKGGFNSRQAEALVGGMPSGGSTSIWPVVQRGWDDNEGAYVDCVGPVRLPAGIIVNPEKVPGATNAYSSVFFLSAPPASIGDVSSSVVGAGIGAPTQPLEAGTYWVYRRHYPDSFHDDHSVALPDAAAYAVDYLVKNATAQQPFLPTALFEAHHDGDNDNLRIPFDGSSTFLSNGLGDLEEVKGASSPVFNVGAGGTFGIRRLNTPSDRGTLFVYYAELVIASLDGANRIIAYISGGGGPVIVAGAGVGYRQPVPITSFYDTTGSDLTVSGGLVHTAAGGGFIMSASLHVNQHDI